MPSRRKSPTAQDLKHQPSRLGKHKTQQ